MSFSDKVVEGATATIRTYGRWQVGLFLPPFEHPYPNIDAAMPAALPRKWCCSSRWQERLAVGRVFAYLSLAHRRRCAGAAPSPEPI